MILMLTMVKNKNKVSLLFIKLLVIIMCHIKYLVICSKAIQCQRFAGYVTSESTFTLWLFLLASKVDQSNDRIECDQTVS